MSTVDRLNNLEKVVNDLTTQIVDLKGKVDQLNSGYTTNLQKTMFLEQTTTSLAKTLSALSSVLTETKVVKGSDILDKMRQMDDDDRKRQIETLEKNGTIKEAKEIKEKSVFVLSETTEDKDGNKTVLAENLFLSFTSPNMTEDLKKQLLNKKAGDSIELSSDDGIKSIIKVKKVYEIVDIQKAVDAEAKNSDDK